MHLCTHNNRVSKHIKQKLTELKDQIEKSNKYSWISVSTMDKKSKQKINKRYQLLEPHYQPAQLHLLLENTLFNNSRTHVLLSTHKTFTKIIHIPGHKFSKNLSVHITQSMFSDRNRIKLGINNRKISEKSPNIWK